MVVDLKPGHFIVNGVNSWTEDGLKVLIQNRPEIQTPRRKRDFKSPLGYSGDLVFDEDAYEPTYMSLELLIEGSSEEEVIDNRDMLYYLFNSAGTIPFIPYFDPGKQYNVICTEPPEFTSKWWMEGNQTAKMELKIQPYKYYLGYDDIEILSHRNVKNPFFVSSQPIIKIEGSGDIKLVINSKEFNIKNVEGHIYINSQIFSSYRQKGSIITNDNSKILFKEYPILTYGDNNISWEGNVSKIILSPRWRSLT